MWIDRVKNDVHQTKIEKISTMHEILIMFTLWISRINISSKSVFCCEYIAVPSKETFGKHSYNWMEIAIDIYNIVWAGIALCITHVYNAL